MNRSLTPAPRVWLRSLVVAGLALLAMPAWAASTCPEVKFGGPASLTVPDFDQPAPGSWVPHPVTINGQPSTPNPGPGVTYQWTQFSGPAVTLVNANTTKVDFNAPDVGASGATVVVRLTVTGCGGSASGDYTINITNSHDVVVNAPPHAVASASPASPTEGQLVTLNGGSSWDPDNNPLTYSWTQVPGPGPAVVLANANQAQASFLAPNVAATTTLTFRLTVSDGSLQNSAETLVNVQWTNDPPVAALSCPSDVNELAAVTLNGSTSSDSDGGIVSYQWLQLEGLPIVPGVSAWNTSSVTFNAPSLGFQQTGLVPFRLTVTDANNASSSATCYVMIHDITPPIISGAQDRTIEATSAAGATVNLGTSAFDAVDGDLSFLLACSPPSGLFPLGQTSVSCSVKDSANNPTSAAFKVTVADTTGPIISAPLSVGVEATGPDGAIVTFDATTTDAVDGDGVATCVPASGSLFKVDDSTVTCNATDSHGNAATPVDIAIHVLDTTAPTLTVPSPLTLEATSAAGAAATFTVSASDIVDGNVDATCDRNSGDTFALGTTTVNCQAVDAHGNTGTGSFTVTVQDTTPPAIEAHIDVTGEATSALGAIVDYTSPATHDIVDGDGTATCMPASGSHFDFGNTTVTCSASDVAGNAATATTFTVHVVDTTPPTIATPTDVGPVEATGPSGAMVFYDSPATSDAVDGPGTASCLPASPSTFAIGSTTVTCTAKDAHDNAALPVTFKVTVVDTTAPVVTPPASVTAEATGPLTAVVHGSATATDAVGVVSLTNDAPDTFPLGTTTITWTAKDAAGNTSIVTSTVTVRDTTAPEIHYLGDITVTAGSNSSAVVNYPEPEGWDLVDGYVEVSCTPVSGATFPIGTTEVHCSATDAHGNEASGSFNVNVNYKWNGFFKPVDMAPVVNTSKAGSAIPLKFSLGGNQGLSILASGYPKSAPMSCGGSVEDPLLETVTAGQSSLQYDASANQYIYVWKTEKAWAGSCRQLQLKLSDGTLHTVSFSFK